MQLLGLAQAMGQLDPHASFEELRDALWLAQYLPYQAPAQGSAPGPAVSAGAAAPPPPANAAAPAPVTGGTTPEHKAVPDALQEADNGPAADDAAVFSGQAAGGHGDGAGGLRSIRLPSPHPLPEAAALARALRPLGRRRRRGPARWLDEEASAEAMAHSGLPQPVMRPLRQRWFDAVVAVDASLPLLAWRPRIEEFLKLLQRRAGLRQVHPFSLHGADGQVLLRSPDGRQANPAVWHHGQGGRLLLVVSDCSGAAWHNGAMARWLQPWAQQMPVAVAQLLPASLWSHTGLGFTDLRVHAQRPGQASAGLQVQWPDWAEGETGLVLPVFALDAAGARQWARMLMAAGGARCPAALLPFEAIGSLPLRAGTGTQASDALTTEQAALVASLRRSAAPQALKLAAALAAIKPLTLPVLRLVQATLLPRPAGLEDLAQVLASGLLQPRVAMAADASFNAQADDQVLLDMAEPVRQELVGGLTRSEWMHLNLAVQRYVQQATGSGFDFLAYLEDRLGSAALAPAALPFARFARQLAERFRPPSAARAATGPRTVNERVAGPGLTIASQAELSSHVTVLQWSANGQRLAAMHALGLDIFDGPRLRHGPRVRQGGWVLHVLCHTSDADAVQALMQQVVVQLEARSSLPVALRMQPVASDDPQEWKARVSEIMIFRSTAVHEDGNEPVPLLAMSASLLPSSAQARQRWVQEMANLAKEMPAPLVLADTWAGLWKRMAPGGEGWLGALQRDANAPTMQQAVATLLSQLLQFRKPSNAAKLEAMAFVDDRGERWRVVHALPGRREPVLHGAAEQPIEPTASTPAWALPPVLALHAGVHEGILALCAGPRVMTWRWDGYNAGAELVVEAWAQGPGWVAWQRAGGEVAIHDTEAAGKQVAELGQRFR